MIIKKCGFFVVGTDTGVGKTLVSLALLQIAKDRGLATAALKPVAAGCHSGPEGWVNDDALALQRIITADLDYPTVNPVALEPAIAPHIAAAQVSQQLSVAKLHKACQPVLQNDQHQFIVVEGAGGWRVPLNSCETLADLAISLQLPVILVVGLRLGCINHALLTAEAIKYDGLRLAGWVANQLDFDMPVVRENLATLAHRLDAPCLGHIPFLLKAEPDCAVEYLDVNKLFMVIALN